MTSSRSGSTDSLWCKLFGHKFQYNVVREEPTLIHTECRRDNCEYERDLTEEWKEAQK